jgi:putative membrane protein
MHSNPSRYTRSALLGAAWISALAAGACKPKPNNADTAGIATGDTAAPRMAADTTKAAADNKLSDPNIVALLDEANKADSAAGAYALHKATRADVKGFAKMMMSEHHALRVQGQALAKKLSITPEAPADDPVKTAGSSEMTALHSAAKGAFDSTYIDQEVTIHKAVLDLAGKAHDDTKTDELKKLIESAKPTIQKHLDKAEDIQKNLGKATS